MIFDTNALSAAADGDRALESILKDASPPAIPVIVLGEFRYGIHHSRHGDRYQKWLTELLRTHQVLRIDEETTVHYVDVRNELRRSGSPIPSNDYWIAALCRQHSMPLLSRDRHFDSVPGIKRIGW